MKPLERRGAPSPWFVRGGAVGMMAIVAGGVAGAGGGGCGESLIDYCDPTMYDPGVALPDFCFPDGGVPCHGDDAGAAEDAATDAPIGTCPSECAPAPPAMWGWPEAVWIGDEGQAPPCPASAPDLAYEGHAELEAPFSCGGCQCGPPAGACGLPSTITVSAAPCPGGGAGVIHTSIDPPVEWDGSCTSAASIAGGALCAGSPCARSVTIGALTVAEGACAAATTGEADIAPPIWRTAVRSCRTAPIACGAGSACMPAAPAGYRTCVRAAGDLDCGVASPYEEKHLFHGAVADTRACAACTCGSPAGSTCVAEIALHTDGACASLPVVSVLAGAGGATCHDVMPGVALGSEAASAPVYTPGTCAPEGGGPVGAASPAEPVTFCCIPMP